MMSSDEYSVLFFIDLGAAFDTVDRRILIKGLKQWVVSLAAGGLVILLSVR